MNLHIKQVHLHFHPHPALASTLMSALCARAEPANDEPVTSAASALTPPKIGEVWPGQGGIYLGVARGENSGPDQHKVMAAETSPELNHAGAQAWAAGLDVDGHKDFQVANRQEGSLICANAKDQVDTSRYHWLRDKYSADSGFVQYFHHGYQGTNLVTAARPSRAVRSFNV